MDIEKRIAKIEHRIAIREGRMAEIDCEIVLLRAVRNKWKRIIRKGSD